MIDLCPMYVYTVWSFSDNFSGHRIFEGAFQSEEDALEIIPENVKRFKKKTSATDFDDVVADYSYFKIVKTPVKRYDYEFPKFVFDRNCVSFRPENQEHNVFFLKAQENYLNTQFQIRGHLFLNEVYDALGVSRTRDGSILGWISNDDYLAHVSFGIDWGSIGTTEIGPINLTFNVTGVICDKI